MKAFSFPAILKNFGKQLSSLASQMPWCNLRVNLGSISVLSRVSRPFSRTSLSASFGTSFGTSRRASHFAAILTILFTIGVGSVWGAYDVPANGKVTLSTKVNNGGRFNVEASGVYHFRPASGYSWSDNNGIKTQSNSGGVVFFIDKSTDVTVQIAHLEAKNAHDVTVHVYSITEEEYKQFDDNKGKANEKDRTYTSLSLTNDNPFVIEIAAEQKEFEGTKKLEESGYYVIVPTGEKSNTYFKSITFSSSSIPSHSVTVSTEDANKGTASAASTIVAEGATTTITATPKTGYQFDHWTVSGTGATLSSTSTNPTTLTMGTSDVTVTAYFVEKTCPTSGTLYSLTAKSATYSVPATTETNMESDYAIVSGGGAYIGNKNSSAGKAQVTETGNGTVYFNGADGYVKLVLDCPIQTGDQLTFENGSGSNQICFTTTNTRSTTYTTASNTYTFPAAFNGASTIYVWRTSGSSTYMHSLTITRPAAASCTNPTASWSTAPADGTAGGNMNASLTTNYVAGVVYTSSNTDVATVSGNGTTTCAINYVAAGTARITATVTGDGSTICVGPATCYTDITVSAQEPETYSITYDGNHPTNAWNADFAVKNIPTEQTLTGGTGTVSNNTPTITENESSEYAIYTFKNWNTAADGKGTSYAAGAAITITENTTLYAQWTPRTYNITYYDTDKTTELEDLEPKNYTYGTGVASLPTPTKDGYTFSSWTKWWNDGEESNVSSISNTTWGDANLAAQWTCAALTLVLDGDPATPAVGSPIGTEYTLTCSASTGAIASYQWKQNTTASTTGAVDAEGTGATTASFSPVPAAAGTYYYYCVATDACDNSVNTAFSGAFTFTAPADPCSEPSKVANEIARFFVPCGTGTIKYEVTDQDASTNDNTFTTYKVGSTDANNWYVDATSGFAYGKLTANDSYIILKLKSGSSFQAGDVVTAYFNRNDANKSGLTLKTQGSSYAITPAATAAGVETSGTYTLVADAIEADGSIKLFRANSSSYVNRIIVTRAPVGASITATKTSPDYVSPDPNNVVLSISTTGASSGWYYRVKNTGTAGYQTPDNTPYNTATWTMTSGLALGANNFVVELYNGSGVKQAESGTITVTAETAYPITIAAGAGGSVSPSGEIKANESGNHIHPAITATPNSGYHFVNWTYSNSNATVADASSASTTVNDARGACTITANFEADAPVATPMITWNLNVGTDAGTTLKSSTSTTDGTNITNIDIDQTNDGADGAGADNRTTKLELATGESAASVDNPDKYELFTFKVACGKKLTPSEVKIKVANVGGTAGGNQNYKAVLYDAYGHSISNTFTGTKSDGTVEEFSITNGGGTYFQGDVTLKLWSCKGASGNASAFHMGTPLTIYGVIGDEATPAATITWNTQPADGQVGSADFAYAVSCSDDSDVTVTSADPSIATIVDGKLHYEAAGTTYLVATATDACGNEITQNSNEFTVTAASVDPDPEPGECVTIFEAKATSKTEFTATTGEITSSNLAEGASFTETDGYTYAVKPNSSNALVIKPKTEETFKVGDKLTFVVYTSGTKDIGFKIGDNTYTQSVSKSLYYFEQELTDTDITNGTTTITFNRNSADARWVAVKIERCAQLPSCTTPVLEDLSAQTKCPGEDVSWIANNTEALQDGETIAYQWNKKGNNTVLSSNATLTLNGITEAEGGTYVVTATVSADGKASKTDSKEVTLTVRPATATPTITANANTIYKGNSVTLTATCASSEVGYQWYTCTDADGNGASEIGGAENAEYTFTAGEAGTYYYKVIVTGDGTHSCGTAEKVYTLVVSTSNSGETTCGEIKGQFTNGAYTFDTDFIIYGINSGGNLDAGASSSSGNNRCGGSGRYLGKQRFAVTFPVDVVSFSFMGYQSSDRTIENVKTTAELLSENTEYQTIKYTSTVTKENNCQTHVITPETAIPANTFVWVELSNGLNISEICYVPVSNVTCTDPQVTATIDNATVCEGTKNVTFTATNYADGAEFQWQKKDGNTWKDINEATSATYTISSVAENAGKYRVIAHNVCNRISEEVTLTVLTAPTFNDFAKTASVMKGNALAISDVQATGATGYAWYKSTDNSLDVAADTKVGTSKDLLLAAASIPEAADQSFYLFCVASNSCGTTESQAITVTVTPFVEEECATKGNEGDREFVFANTGCGQDTYGDSKTPVWKTGSRSKYLTYTAPEGRYFATAKVTVAHSDKTKCGYAYSTDGGTTWTFKELEGLSTTLTAITIELSELSETVNAFRISRNLQDDNEKDWGVTNGTFYLAEACFTYENACTETTLTVGSYNDDGYNMSVQMGFVEPTFTLKSGETILEGQTLTYTSSNTAIATVDEDGNVTFEGMTGTVTITATFAGGKISETEYCACQGSYTITVYCTDRAPEIVAAAGTNLNGCNNSITLEAKMEGGTTSFTEGTFQWYRDGEAIEGATSASYEVVRAGTYTVSRTHTCTTMSSNSAVVTNDNVEPKVERLTPFQYYHVNKDYSNQMKNRHLFAVTSYGTLDGKRYHLTATRNGEALDLSSSTAFFTIPSSDNAVDTVMIDLNELTNKYAEGDEIVITCAPINNCNTASAITTSITIHVIGDKPTLALICSGANGEGTRATKELVVGGDFLTGYNKADLCQQTGNKTFDATKEWGFYTELKEKYIVTPVNGYAEFNKLNYEPFDILLLTDYPKASKSEAAATILDDMAALCDYRPLLSLKAHMVAKSPSKWAAKGFTTSPVVPAVTSQYANIVCYAHPMFDNLDDAQKEGIYHDHDDFNQLVYKILTGPGHESGKGLQGFELKDADNFVTIGLIHYNAEAEMVTHTDGDDTHTHLKWTPAANDRQLVAIAERQANIEARMILFAINCGAQSKQTPMGRQVLLTCLDYLLKTDPIEVADCRLTFDNGEGNTNWGQSAYEGTGTKGDGLWSTAANWGPEYKVVPGRNNDVRIAAPCTVDANEVEVLSVHITEDGSLTIPADKSLTARSTILRADEHGNVYPTNVEDISLGSTAGGNASLILNNERGDTKAGVAMYSKAKAGKGTTWQYIGTPHSDVSNATYNYYDSWIYRWNPSAGWEVVPTGGAVYPWVGYCITHPELGHTYWMEGTLVETTTQEIEVPSNSYQIIGNSWTAPIQIANFEETDFDGIETKTIYFFNTGSDPEGDNSLTPNATYEARWAPGTYIPVPIHSAEYTGEDTEIPSMQGFYVANNNPTSAGTLHLDYERHVRAPRKNTPSGPMHAPARITDTDNEPIVAKLLVRGKRYDDKLILLEREDFTGGYDSGWDGDKWDGGTISPTIWAVNEIGGADAVAAIPEFEGTVIGFRAGEDNIYTIHFDYDGMEEALYLLDTETKIYTRVLKGNSYTFACPDKAEHNRFILTRKAPQIATGTENIATGENAKAVKFIKDDKIFIFVNGILYDATGKMVIR